jgi:hypothetical protein
MSASEAHFDQLILSKVGQRFGLGASEPARECGPCPGSAPLDGFSVRFIKNVQNGTADQFVDRIAELLGTKGFTDRTVPASSSMKYMVGVFSNTAFHRSSLSRRSLCSACNLLTSQ